MPIREFRCNSCGSEFEALVFSRRDECEQKCPKCGDMKLTTLFSVFGVAGTDVKLASSSNCGTCTSHNCSTCG